MKLKPIQGMCAQIYWIAQCYCYILPQSYLITVVCRAFFKDGGGFFEKGPLCEIIY